MSSLNLVGELEAIDLVRAEGEDAVLGPSMLELLLSRDEGAATLCSSKKRWLFECLSGERISQLNLVISGAALGRRAFESVFAAVGRFEVCFCGDLDPNDLAIAFSILEGGIAGEGRVGGGLQVRWIGVADAWIHAFETQVGPLGPLLGTMSSYECGVWSLLKRYQVDERIGLGDRCIQLLDAGKKLDIDAMVHRRFGAEFESALKALICEALPG
jgi:hypothetical protein